MEAVPGEKCPLARVGGVISISGTSKTASLISALLDILRYFSRVLILGGRFDVESFSAALHRYYVYVEGWVRLGE